MCPRAVIEDALRGLEAIIPWPLPRRREFVHAGFRHPLVLVTQTPATPFFALVYGLGVPAGQAPAPRRGRQLALVPQPRRASDEMEETQQPHYAVATF